VKPVFLAVGLVLSWAGSACGASPRALHYRIAATLDDDKAVVGAEVVLTVPEDLGTRQEVQRRCGSIAPHLRCFGQKMSVQLGKATTSLGPLGGCQPQGYRTASYGAEQPDLTLVTVESRWALSPCGSPCTDPSIKADAQDQEALNTTKIKTSS
jgi:hypothetical protein